MYGADDKTSLLHEFPAAGCGRILAGIDEPGRQLPCKALERRCRMMERRPSGSAAAVGENSRSAIPKFELIRLLLDHCSSMSKLHQAQRP
jgi:hypothetical protein